MRNLSVSARRRRRRRAPPRSRRPRRRRRRRSGKASASAPPARRRRRRRRRLGLSALMSMSSRRRRDPTSRWLLRFPGKRRRSWPRRWPGSPGAAPADGAAGADGHGPRVRATPNAWRASRVGTFPTGAVPREPRRVSRGGARPSDHTQSVYAQAPGFAPGPHPGWPPGGPPPFHHPPAPDFDPRRPFQGDASVSGAVAGDAPALRSTPAPPAPAAAADASAKAKPKRKGKRERAQERARREAEAANA